MSKYNANVVIQMERGISPELSRQVQAALTGETGVIHARTSRTVGHLMLVDYDVRNTSSQAILERIRREGVRVNLIGM